MRPVNLFLTKDGVLKMGYYRKRMMSRSSRIDIPFSWLDYIPVQEW